MADIPAIQQDIAVIPDGLFHFNTPRFKFSLKYRPISSFNVSPGFINAVNFHSDRPYTQKKPPRPDEVDIYSSQD